MPTIGKQTCHVCHQSINERQIALYSGMVSALATVFKYCKAHSTDKFSRKEVKHLFKNENDTARFGDWLMFGALVFRPLNKGKGHYELDMARCRAFFGGNLKIPSMVYKNPLTGETRRENYVFIDEIKNLTAFLDANKEFIAEYRDVPATLF